MSSLSSTYYRAPLQSLGCSAQPRREATESQLHCRTIVWLLHGRHSRARRYAGRLSGSPGTTRGRWIRAGSRAGFERAAERDSAGRQTSCSGDDAHGLAGSYRGSSWRRRLLDQARATAAVCDQLTAPANMALSSAWWRPLPRPSTRLLPTAAPREVPCLCRSYLFTILQKDRSLVSRTKSFYMTQV